MFGKSRREEALRKLQEELLAAEEEEYEEIDPEPCEEEDPDFFGFDEDDDFDQEPENYYASRYGRGSPKRFEDRDFFEDDVEDHEILYKKDYKRAKRKKRRQNFGMTILVILELLGIGAILLWWASWTQ